MHLFSLMASANATPVMLSICVSPALKVKDCMHLFSLMASARATPVWLSICVPTAEKAKD